MTSNNWILKFSRWCCMLGALVLQCEHGLLLMSIYSCLYLVKHHLIHNLQDCLCSFWMHQSGTLLTLWFKALLIHFEYHWHLASQVSHFIVTIISLFSHFPLCAVVCLLFVGLCNYVCSCLDCALVVSVVVFDSL